MGENKKYYWLKLKEDFFRQPEIKKLRKIAGGDTYTIIYLKMQLLSLKKEGRLYFTGLEDTFIEEVALEIDEEPENVSITIQYLIKCKLLEELNENEFLLNKATLSIGNETQGAERVRKFRDNKKDIKALQCNTEVTKCNTEIDIELEKEIDIEIKPKEIINVAVKKIEYAERVHMLEDEYEKLINKYSQKVIDDKITDLDLWKGSTGKKNKSDYLTLLTWLRKDTKVNTPTKEDTWGGMKQFN